MVKIRLINLLNSRPAWGEKVWISRHGSGFLDIGGVFGTEKTDQNGEVSFSKLELPAKGKIFVNGNEIYDGELQKMMTFKI